MKVYMKDKEYSLSFISVFIKYKSMKLPGKIAIMGGRQLGYGYC